MTTEDEVPFSGNFHMAYSVTLSLEPGQSARDRAAEAQEEARPFFGNNRFALVAVNGSKTQWYSERSATYHFGTY